jgi:TonB family protein
MIKYFLIFCILTSPSLLFAGDASEKYLKHQEKMKAYSESVHSIIEKNLVIPETYKTNGKKISAELNVFMDIGGKVTSHKWSKRSGDAVFDEACESAVSKIKKLPDPPRDIWFYVMKEGLLIKFAPIGSHFMSSQR